MLKHIAVERVQCGIVDIGFEHAFAQVVEDYDACGSAQPTKGPLVEIGPYLRTGLVPNDPWGHPYIYRSPGEHGAYDIISYGADGQPGGEGNDADIGSWEL